MVNSNSTSAGKETLKALLPTSNLLYIVSGALQVLTASVGFQKKCFLDLKTKGAKIENLKKVELNKFG